MKNKKKPGRINFIIKISTIVSMIGTLILVIIIYYYNIHINKELITRARTIIGSISIINELNGSTGAIYIEKNNNNKISVTGNFDLKKNVFKESTRSILEMSPVSQKSELYSYNIRSLKPLNTANSADNFEKEALNLFENGTKDFKLKVNSGKNVLFRYMVPLYAKDDCLICHSRQGYKTGDIIGGLSIIFDITPGEKNAIVIKYSAIVSGFLSLFFIIVLFVSTIHLKVKLTDSEIKNEILSVTDELTSLFNRNYFFQKLNEEFERSRRYNYPLSLIIANIDSLKFYNEKYGLQTGDLIIKSIAQIIKPLCRLSDTVSRYGEEEFAIILPNTNEKGAIVIAEKLRSNVEDFKFKKESFSVTISLGISTMTSDTAYSAETLIYDADTALYRSKESGSNKAVLYSPA